MSETKVYPGEQKLTREFTTPKPVTAGGSGDTRSTKNTANVVLFDCSGSMNDPIGKGDSRSKMQGVKDGVSTFIANLPQSAYLSAISFSTTAEVASEMQQIAEGKLKMIEAVQCCIANGKTAMAEALMLASAQFKNIPEDSIKRLYILTDGMPDTDPTALAEKLKSENVQITTVGFGDNDQIDEALLRKLASVSETGAPFYYHFTDAAKMTGFLKVQSTIINK